MKRYRTREEAVADGVPPHLAAYKLDVMRPGDPPYIRISEEEAARDKRCADMMRIVNASNT